MMIGRGSQSDRAKRQMKIMEALGYRRPLITTTDEAVAQLAHIRNERQECFVVLTLDAKRRLLRNEIVFKGTVDRSLVHPREIFALAIEDRASSIIVGHNHPSGDPEPSEADIDVASRLRQAGEILGIEVLENLVVTEHAQWSY